MTGFGPPPQREITEEYLQEDNGRILVGVSVGCAAATTVILGSRFYSKRLGGAPLGLDDVFLTAAYVVNLGMCALALVMIEIGGVGRHVEAVSHGELIEWAKCILAFEFIYLTSIALPKMAIVFLYLKLFNWKGVMRNLAILLQITIASTSLSLIIAACFQCRPLSAWWEEGVDGGKCFNVEAFFHAQSIPSIVLDLFVMALPVRTIWGLKLPVYKRIGLVMIFVVASFGFLASIFRAVAFFDPSAFEDRTFASVSLVGWSIAETSAYIVTTCLPSLVPLISRLTPRSVKAMIRKTLSHAVSKSYLSGHHDDEVVLTARSKRGHTGVNKDVERDPWPLTDGRGISSDSEDAFALEDEHVRGTRTIVRNSGVRDGERWSEEGIQVKTEVRVERATSIASRSSEKWPNRP